MSEKTKPELQAAENYPLRTVYRNYLEEITPDNFTLARAFTTMLAGEIADYSWDGMCELFYQELSKLHRHLKVQWPQPDDIPEHIGDDSMCFLENLIALFYKLRQPVYQDLIELELHAAAIAEIKAKLHEHSKQKYIRYSSLVPVFARAAGIPC